jgi:hypothetical protein
MGTLNRDACTALILKEPRLHGVSKDGPRAPPSFETRAKDARTSERVNVLVLSICNGWRGVIPSMW